MAYVLVMWLCTHVSVCVCTCVYVCACIHMDVEAKGWHVASFLNCSSLYLRQGLLLSLNQCSYTSWPQNLMDSPDFLSTAGLQATVFSQVIHKDGMMFTLYSQLRKHSCQPRASSVTACPIGEQKGKQSFSRAKRPETLPQSSVTPRESRAELRSRHPGSGPALTIYLWANTILGYSFLHMT